MGEQELKELIANNLYSQSRKVGNTLYISGQIPIDTKTKELIQGDILEQLKLIFDNIKALAEAANCTMANCVKINVSLIDMNDFYAVNEVMNLFFIRPYPARACVGVSSLPCLAQVQVEAIFVYFSD